jgi:hypothetical protein
MAVRTLPREGAANIQIRNVLKYNWAYHDGLPIFGLLWRLRGWPRFSFCNPRGPNKPPKPSPKTLHSSKTYPKPLHECFFVLGVWKGFWVVLLFLLCFGGFGAP